MTDPKLLADELEALMARANSHPFDFTEFVMLNRETILTHLRRDVRKRTQGPDEFLFYPGGPNGED